MGEKGIMVAVGAVVQDERGRILLVKHLPERRGFWQGKWICPGGKLRPGESIPEGIQREVEEETHLKVRLTTPLVPFERIVTEGQHAGLHVIYIDSLAYLVEGELQPDSDVGEARWVKKEELPQIWEELHEDTQRLLVLAGVAPAGSSVRS